MPSGFSGMKILHLISSLSGGGAERQLSSLAPEMVRAGNELHIAHLYDGPAKPDLSGSALHKLEAHSNYSLSVLFVVASLIRSIKPDILQTWNLQMDIMGGVLAKVFGIPWIMREPSSPIGAPDTIKRRLRIALGGTATAVVVNSVPAYKFWRGRLPESRCYFIPNGVPLDSIVSAPRPDDVPFLGGESPVLLCAGRLDPLKNVDQFLRVFAALRRRVDIKAIICGEGPQRAELERLRDTLDLNADVVFTGHLPSRKLWGAMNNSALFVSLSAHEGCPNSVAEALAAGCRVVLSDIEAHRAAFAPYGAILADPDSASAVEEAILGALPSRTDPSSRVRHSPRSVEDWAIERRAGEWGELYRKIVPGMGAR